MADAKSKPQAGNAVSAAEAKAKLSEVEQMLARQFGRVWDSKDSDEMVPAFTPPSSCLALAWFGLLPLALLLSAWTCAADSLEPISPDLTELCCGCGCGCAQVTTTFMKYVRNVSEQFGGGMCTAG